MAALFAATGPDSERRAWVFVKLPNGAARLPVQFSSDGRALVMLISPPMLLRPNRALWAPRTNSTCSMSASSRLDEFAFSCGTPSMNVVTPGLFGLDPIARNLGLLSFRALNSLNQVLGAKSAASLTLRGTELSSVSFDTGVTLAGV